MKVKNLSQSGVITLLVACVTVLGFTPQSALAANTPTFNQQINAGVLAIDILDGSHVPVANPSVAMTAKNFAFTCQSGASASTGLFGTSSQRAYVTNPSGADNGWNLSLAATGGPASLWTDTTKTYDFNDPTTAGCTDGPDTDSKAGQLTINPSVGTITTDCTTCTTTGITKGSQAGFNEGSLDNITLLSAGVSAEKVWQGYLTGVAISQTIPAETAAGAYSLNLTLTATAL